MRRANKVDYKAIALMSKEAKFLEKFETWQCAIKNMTQEEYEKFVVGLPFTKLVAITEQFCRTTRRV